MASLSIPYNDFISGTTIISTQVDQNNAAIVDYINARNSAASTWDNVSTIGAFTSTLTSNQVILGTTRTVTISAGTPASASRTWTIPDISTDGTFASLTGTQTFSGSKTFSIDTLFFGGVDSIATIRFGSDAAAYTVTDATTKRGQLGVPHYSSGSQRSVCVASVVSSSTANSILLGGGSTTLTAATDITFITSSSNTNITGGTTAGTVDNGHRFIIGTGASRTINAVTPSLQIEGITTATARQSITLNSNSAAGAQLMIAKTRGTSNGAVTIVQASDFIGGISWIGANGVDMSAQGAYIFASVQGTPSSSSMPCRLDFATTAAGAVGSTVAMSLDATQDMLFTNGGSNSTKIANIKFGTDSVASRYSSIQGFRGADAAQVDLRFFTMAGDSAGVLERLRLANDGIGTFTTSSTKHTVNYKVTIADDAVAALTTLVVSGSINTITVMRQSDTSWSGIVQCRMGGTPTIVKIGGGANFATSTSVLSGTTGIDGQATISSQAAAIQLENRTGSSAEFYISVFSGG